jgi:endo-1,4-beta-xylanase
MNYLKHLLILATCALALPSPAEVPTGDLEAGVSNPTDEGTTIDSPYYLHKWAEDLGEVDVTNGPGSRFDVQWKNSGDFIGGKGWKVGTDRTIFYNGTHNSNSHSFVGIYGWTTVCLTCFFLALTFTR